MNIYICQTYERWTQDDIENGDTDDTGFHFQNVPYTFREVVELMQAHDEPSQHPMTESGASSLWFTAYDANDGTIENIKDGITENTSIHFSRCNDPRTLKYWLKAAHYAGIE